MALIQLHHQLANGTNEFVAQTEFGGEESELNTFFRTTAAAHPLPPGAMWLVVPEQSKYFVMTHGEQVACQLASALEGHTLNPGDEVSLRDGRSFKADIHGTLFEIPIGS